MEASDGTTCPACGSARLHWHVERSGRRGHPLSARTLVWRCPACDAPGAVAGDASAGTGAPPAGGPA